MDTAQRNILMLATGISEEEGISLEVRDILRTLKMIMSTDSKEIKSSMFNDVSYDKNTQKLEIRFSSGGTYVYNEVEEDIYRGLTKAASKGQYFWRHIRPWYEYEKLSPQPA